MSILILTYVLMLVVVTVKEVDNNNNVVYISYIIKPNDNGVYINLNIGVPLQSVSLPISLRSRISTISSINYSTNTNNDNDVVCDSLILAGNGFYISQYCFNYLPNATTTTMEEISFSFKPRNDTNSLIHALKQNKQIDKLQFALFPKYDNNDTKLPRGIIYCGGVDDDVIKSYEYITKCAVSKVSANWGCFLYYVIFQGSPGKYPIHYYIRFDYNVKYIYVTKTFLQLLLEYLLNNGAQCSIIKTTANPKEQCIQCQYNVILKFKDISFVIDDNIFTIPSVDLFECIANNSLCLSIIRYHIDAHYGWLFGSMFLHRYGVVYDIDTYTISFHSKTPFSTYTSLPTINNTPYTSLIKHLYIINISLITLMCINNIFTIKYKI